MTISVTPIPGQAAAKTSIGHRPLANARRTACRPAIVLFGHYLAGAAELGGEVLQLGQAILHRQDGLLIIDVDARHKRQVGQGGREHVD